MRILETPMKKLQGKVKYNIRCSNKLCSALIEVFHAELEIFTHIDSPILNAPILYLYCMKCPACQRKTYLSPKSLPDYEIFEVLPQESIK